MKRIDNLFEQVVDYENLVKAIDEVNRTHHWLNHHRPNNVTAWIEETKAQRVVELEQILRNGFTPKEPRISQRYDRNAKKWRTISEPAQWPDKYVHHALMQILEPILFNKLDPYCCGSVRSRGTRLAQDSLKEWMRTDHAGTKHELSGDIYHFYDSIKSQYIMNQMRRIIKDAQVLDLIERITQNGIFIGAYTSQWFANILLLPLDRLIRESGYAKHYVRYMDNLTILGSNKRKLRKLKILIEEWLAAHELKLKGDWQIFPTKSRIPSACGYRYGRTYTIPRKHVFFNMKLAIYKMQKAKYITLQVAQGILSRVGFLKHCNNYNLYKILFARGRFTYKLKCIIRKYAQKERLQWNTYLEHKMKKKSLKPRAMLIPT